MVLVICNLLKIEGTLQQHVISSSLRLVGPLFIFQQDIDLEVCQVCQSPELNSVEMVRNGMDHRVKAKVPRSAQRLWELPQNCWKTISGGYLMKLITIMPRLYKAVIKAGYFE